MPLMCQHGVMVLKQATLALYIIIQSFENSASARSLLSFLPATNFCTYDQGQAVNVYFWDV